MKKISNQNEKIISIIGLGYVGLPLANALAKKGCYVIGYDLNKKKIRMYKSGIDPTNEIGDEELKKAPIHFTTDENELKKSKFHIIAVPTPVNSDHTPDLKPVVSASEIVGRNLTPGMQMSSTFLHDSVSRTWRGAVSSSLHWSVTSSLHHSVSSFLHCSVSRSLHGR